MRVIEPEVVGREEALPSVWEPLIARALLGVILSAAGLLAVAAGVVVLAALPGDAGLAMILGGLVLGLSGPVVSFSKSA